MGRVIGLIACSSLVAAALWLTNGATTTRTVSAGADNSVAAQQAASRDAYRRGKEMYLRGRYSEALPLLDKAAQAKSGLTSEEIKVAGEYARRTRQQLGSSAVRAQSPEGSLPEGVGEAAKTRVERLMAQAEAAARKGNTAEASRLATQAFQISREAKLRFGKGEVAPGEFLAQLNAAGVEGGVENMAWAQDPRSAKSGNISLIAGEESTAADKGFQPKSGSAKDQATALVVSARMDLKAGRLEEARRKALEAIDLDVSYDLFEDRPELVLNDVDRKAGTVTVAGAAQTTKAAAPSASPANTEARDQAARLVAEARAAMKAGQMDVARAKAAEAQKLNAAYKLFDDRPELVLSEIDAARAVTVAKAETAPDWASMGGSSDAPANQPNPAKDEVRKLLAEARAAMKAGLIDDARRNAMDAEKIASANNVTYELFDDRPEIVIADAARMATRGSNAAAVAAADPAMQAKRAQAEKLLAQAKAAMDTGKLDVARKLAAQAEELNVAYDVFAETPENVLASIDQAETGVPGGTSGVANAVAKSGGSNSANVDLASAKAAAPAGMSFEGPAVVNPDGLSAIDLYNRGMFELNRGNREAAYQNFFAAHQSGEKLDGYRQRRMQDYLRELAPKGGNGLQMVSHTEGAPQTGDAPGIIDEAAREQSLKYDRIRTETLNTIFKAERMREKDPEQAMQLIDRQIATVEGAELPADAATTLTASLGKTRTSLENEILKQKPNLEMKRSNEETRAQIDGSVKNKIRIEQEHARMVEEFNKLMKEKRFAEAELLAKKARELMPNEPTSELMFYKARLARRTDANNQLRDNKDESIWRGLQDVEEALVSEVSDAHPYHIPKGWGDLTNRRKKYGLDNRKRSQEELKIQESLSKVISLHEDNVPLGEVIKKLATMADINIYIDARGLEEEGAGTDRLVSIDLDGIQMKNALKLVLEPFNLAYVIQDDVLKITSRLRQQGELVVVTYPVADLVIPIPNFVAPTGASGITDEVFGTNRTDPMAMGGMGGGNMMQLGPNVPGGLTSAPSGDTRSGRHFSQPDFDTLSDLISRTIAPETWQVAGGEATIQHFETTLSLVVRQTQAVHDEIADLLQQLRRLQDLQVTVEVRFVTVSDSFFERIGVDFDFNVQDTVGGPKYDNNGLPIAPFGSVILPTQGLSGSTSTRGTTGTTGTTGGTSGTSGTSGTTGTSTSTTGTSSSFFTQGPTRQLTNQDSYQKGGTVVGLSNPSTFSQSLDIPFQQGSFDVGVPDYGGYNPAAGVQVGMAILSDLEAFFFIQAAQGDKRSNLLFAPKVTLFNGQSAYVASQTRRPFVTSLIPTVGFFSVGFQPQITVIPEGVSLQVTAVISADRRFVRLTLTPFFSSITDVFTFSYVSGGSGNTTGNNNTQSGNTSGGLQNGNSNNQFGFGGIGGVTGASNLVSLLAPTQTTSQTGNNGNNNNNNTRGNNSSSQTITVQQPVVEIVTVETTVSVPDGGTILMGGVKRLREGRNMSGVPILNKIPYVSRLFKNSGVGRETQSLMMMVTPRIIIQEEEEELLGIDSQ